MLNCSNIKSKPPNITTPLHGINHSLFKKQLCLNSSYSKLKCPDNLIRECILNGSTPDIYIYFDTSSNFDSSTSFNTSTTSLSYINSSDENDNINTICVLSKRFYDIHQTINNVNKTSKDLFGGPFHILSAICWLFHPFSNYFWNAQYFSSIPMSVRRPFSSSKGIL